jgi:hypothetical protein
MNPPPPPPPQPNPAKQLQQDVAKWQQLKTWLASAKEQESALRQSIANRVFAGVKLPTGAFPEGTVHNVAEGETANFKMKLETKWSRDILEELITPTLNEAGLSAEERDKLVKRKPELSVKAYKALSPAQRAVVDKMLITKQGAITLEVIELPK